MSNHRIVRFTVASEPEGLKQCPLNLYQWKRTDSGHSLVLADGAAYEMHNALVGREGVAETDVTEDYFIGTTEVDHARDNLGTIMLDGVGERSTVAVLRTNLERVLCTLHDFEIDPDVYRFKMAFMGLAAVRAFTERLEEHVKKSGEQGTVALVDAVEVARLLRAITDKSILFRSNMSAPLQRAASIAGGQSYSFWSPDVRWPATGDEEKPSGHLVRGVEDEDEMTPPLVLHVSSMEEAAATFLAPPCVHKVCVVRSATQEAIFAKKPDGALISEATWVFERGGTLLCGKPERPDGDHYFVDVNYKSQEEEPGHPAARRGVDSWLLCSHCDAWADYNYGEGISEAVEEALALSGEVKS